MQNFRPNYLLVWFLIQFQKKFHKKKKSQNYQKIELWSPVKGSRPLNDYPKLLLDLFKSQRKKIAF